MAHAIKVTLGLMACLTAGTLFMTACSAKHGTPSGNAGNTNGNNGTEGSTMIVAGTNPVSGPAGTDIVITGSGFGTSQGSVEFGDTAAPISSWSDTSISAVVPDVTAGSTRLSVVSGTQTAGVGFTVLPFISEISKADVVLSDTIVITGTGFGTTQGIGSINYAGTVLPVTSWSSSRITAVVGNITHAAAGPVNVSVNNTMSNGITLTTHPSVSRISPDTAERGDGVSITGCLFGATQGTSSIAFAGSGASVISWSDALIRAKVPNGAVKGDVVVTVNGIPSSGLGFTVTKTFYSINRPTGIAVDENNDLYVANYNEGTLIKVLSGGLTQTTIYKGLAGPMALYYQSPSALFVANQRDGTIRKLTLGTPVTGSTFASGFSMPSGIAIDDAGNMYVTNYGNNTISRIDLGGTVSTFAVGLNKPMGIVFTGPTGLKSFKVINRGNGTISTVDGTGVVASYVTGLDTPKYAMADNAYNLYVTSGSNIIKVLSPSGFTVTYAADLSNPYGLAMDPSGFLYTSDFDDNSISRTDSGYQVYAKGLYNPWGVVFTPTGAMFIANKGSLSTGGGSLSMVTAGGSLYEFVGPLDHACNGFGAITPAGIAIGFNDDLFVATPGAFKALWISEVTYDGTVSAFGTCAHKQPGFSGNYWGIAFSAGAPGPLLYATDQQYGEVITVTSSATAYRFASGFNAPEGIAIDGSGNVYVANTAGDTVSVVSAAGGFTTTYASGFSRPSGIAIDAAGNLYVSNYTGGSVSLVTPAKQLLTYATGIPAPTGIAIRDRTIYVASESQGKVFKLVHPVSTYAAGFNDIRGITKGADSRIYIADYANNAVYRIDPGGLITTFAQGITALSWFVFDTAGDMYVSDFSNERLLRYSGGLLSVFASGLNGPAGMAYDSVNDLLYVADYRDGTLSVINDAGSVSTFAVGLSGPMGVALLSPGEVYVANSASGTIVKVAQGSGISVCASGLGLPVGMALDGRHNLYVADQSADMVYLIGIDGTAFPFAMIDSPYGIAFDAVGNLFVSDTRDERVEETVLH
ncbi:MAG: IPT/TIG domain-containing protein [Deltaproteobacteria bacterium]|nr:IPT/TIG domain-containing protein [Deltaproteobacteria bacterium]